MLITEAMIFPESINETDNAEILARMARNANPLLEQMNQIVFFKNTSFQYVDCNNRLIEFSRLNNKKMILGREDYDLPWAEDTDFYRMVDKEILNQKEKRSIMQVRVASGEKIAAIQDKKPLKNPYTGEIIGIMAMMLEVHTSKMNEFITNIKERDKRIVGDEKKLPKNYFFQQYDQYNLSPREIECLFYMIRGMTIKQIANILKKSPRTIEKFMLGIKKKMGCQHKTEIIERAYNENLISLVPETINIDSFNEYLR